MILINLLPFFFNLFFITIITFNYYYIYVIIIIFILLEIRVLIIQNCVFILLYLIYVKVESYINGNSLTFFLTFNAVADFLKGFILCYYVLIKFFLLQ